MAPSIRPDAAPDALNPLDPANAGKIQDLARQYFGANFPYQEVQKYLDSPMGQSLAPAQKIVMQHIIQAGKGNAEERIARADVAQANPFSLTGRGDQGMQERLAQGQSYFDAAVGSLKASLKIYAAAGTEFARAAIPGIGLAPNPVTAEVGGMFASKAEEQAFNDGVKPWVDIGGMFTQFYIFHTALTSIGKMPAVASVVEQLSQRMRDIGVGVTTYGLTDAFRINGLPADPDWTDPSGKLAKKLSSAGLPDRAALAVAGAVVASPVSAVVAGLARGIQMGRTGALALRLVDNPTTSAQITDGLTRLGIDLGENPSRYKIAETLLKMGGKGPVPNGVASALGGVDARAQMIADNILQDGKLEVGSDDARVLASLFRANPGGVSVATNITDPEAAQKAAKILGLNLEFHSIPATDVITVGPKPKPTMKIDASTVETASDVLETGATPQEFHTFIGRPNIAYDAAASLQSDAKRVNGALLRASQTAQEVNLQKGAKDIFLLSDGSTARGGFNVDAVAAKLKMNVPVVAGQSRADLALQNISRYIRMSVDDAENVRIELPQKITQEQFNRIGRVFDGMAFKDVTLVNSAGLETPLSAPFGAQVQDAIANLVKPNSITPALNQEMISQFAKSGVFRGQAAVLADGSPVEMVGFRGALKGSGKRYTVTDLATKQVINVPESQLTILPTTINNEVAPSSLFAKYLDPAEQSGFARIRRGINDGLGAEITTKRQLDQFAASRGFQTRAISGGKYQIQFALNGDPVVFDGLAGAVDYIRANAQPLPDLTPPQLAKFLGTESNFNYIGGSGQPPQFGEPLHIPFEHYQKAVEDMPKDPLSWWKANFQPSRRLMAHIEDTYGIPTLQMFDQLQTQSVARHNFVISWYHGTGGETLPSGVRPLNDIFEAMGKDEATHEAMTAWLETPRNTPDADKLLAAMSPEAAKVAPAFRNFYDAMFNRLGIEADFLETYAPHFRNQSPQAGNNYAAHMALWGDRPKPAKAADFLSDYMREGMLDFYDLHAGRVALKWLEAGATNRFMKDGMDALANLTKVVAGKNESVATAMAFFSQALKGSENRAGREALGQTIKSMFSRIAPGLKDAQLVDITDNLSNMLTGAAYTSTQGWRYGAAVRNASSILTMVYPFVGRENFLEAVGAALTPEGRALAAKANVIAYKGGSLVGREALSESMFGRWNRLVDASLYSYDKADEFTRATAFLASRGKAAKALTEFGEGAVNASDIQLNGLKRTLIKDSGMFLAEPAIQNEFLRRASRSADDAAEYAGKFTSDITNFLYGRGMQAKALRSVPGKLFGQFGSWPMWYVDYLRRVGVAATSGEYKAEGMKVLLRHALVNAAIVGAGYETGVDMYKWATYNSIFYTGGPGVQALEGVATLVQGMGGVSGTDNPGNGERQMTAGAQLLGRTLPAYLPFFYAGRDALRLATGLSNDDYTQSVAALLATTPTAKNRSEAVVNRLLGQADDKHPYGSSAGITDDILSTLVTQPDATVDLAAAAQQIRIANGATPLGVPGATIPGKSQQQPVPPSAGSLPVPPATIQPRTPPAIQTPRIIRERAPIATRPAGSRPPPVY